MTAKANQTGGETGKHPDHFVAEWRTYRNLTQVELGEMVGASHSKISRIENGDTELKPSFAKKLARFFNIPLPALYTINPMGEGRQTAEMLDVWAAIDPDKRDDALRVLRALANGSSGSRTG